jgi:hypothetical protein
MDTLRIAYCLQKHINTCMLHTDKISVLINSLLYHALLQVLLSLSLYTVTKVQQNKVGMSLKINVALGVNAGRARDSDGVLLFIVMDDRQEGGKADSFNKRGGCK